MNWCEYKDICDRTNVFSRWAIERTRDLLSPRLCTQLERGTGSDAIPKPDDHKGDHRTDMFEVNLSLATQQAIVDELTQRSEGESAQNHTTMRISPLLKAWEELLRESQTR